MKKLPRKSFTFVLSTVIFLYGGLILLTALFCDNSNPAAPDPAEYISVYLVLTENGRATKIYWNDQIISYLQYQWERDTIKVPDRAELKARIYKSGDFEYKVITATNHLLWELP